MLEERESSPQEMQFLFHRILSASDAPPEFASRAQQSAMFEGGQCKICKICTTWALTPSGKYWGAIFFSISYAPLSKKVAVSSSSTFLLDWVRHSKLQWEVSHGSRGCHVKTPTSVNTLCIIWACREYTLTLHNLSLPFIRSPHVSMHFLSGQYIEINHLLCDLFSE